MKPLIPKDKSDDARRIMFCVNQSNILKSAHVVSLFSPSLARITLYPSRAYCFVALFFEPCLCLWAHNLIPHTHGDEINESSRVTDRMASPERSAPITAMGPHAAAVIAHDSHETRRAEKHKRWPRGGACSRFPSCVTPCGPGPPRCEMHLAAHRRINQPPYPLSQKKTQRTPL